MATAKVRPSFCAIFVNAGIHIRAWLSPINNRVLPAP